MKAIVIIILILPSYLFAQKNAPRKFDRSVKILNSITDKAIVYFLNERYGRKIAIYNDNNSLFGQIKSNQYAIRVLPPGNHLFSVRFINKWTSFPNSSGVDKTLELKAGRIYYLAIRSEKGKSPRIIILKNEYEDGKMMLYSRRLSSKSGIYENQIRLDKDYGKTKSFNSNIRIRNNIINSQPIQDKATVYFINNSNLKQDVYYNSDSLIGETRNNQFVYIILDSGSHVFYTKFNLKSEDKSKILTKSRELEVYLNPNKIYYFSINEGPNIDESNSKQRDQLKSLKIGRKMLLITKNEDYFMGIRDAKMYKDEKWKLYADRKASFNPNFNLLFDNDNYRAGYEAQAKTNTTNKVLKIMGKVFAIIVVLVGIDILQYGVY